MDLQQAMDEFLLYLDVEKNCSIHIIQAYAFDLLSFQTPNILKET